MDPSSIVTWLKPLIEPFARFFGRRLYARLRGRKRESDTAGLILYAKRSDASDDIHAIVKAERQEVTLIAGSGGGTFRLVPDLARGIPPLEGCRMRVLLSHPTYMAMRARVERISEHQQRQRMLERIHTYLEHTSIPIEDIRLYLSPPTCSAVIAHAQRKLFINPYTLGARAEETLSLLVDGTRFPKVFREFVHAHLEGPWDKPDLCQPLQDFIEEQNADIAKSLLDKAFHKRPIGSDKRPLFIAINGCTAVGKSTLAARMAHSIRNMRSKSCAILETDGWLKSPRWKRIEEGLTGFDPEAYTIDDLSDTINSLSDGREGPNRKYNPVSGMPEDAENISPTEVVIVDGLMSTHPSLVSSVDFSVWIECTGETHKNLRIERDVNPPRSYSEVLAQSIWENHARAWPDFEKMCKPSDCSVVLRANRARMLILDEVRTDSGKPNGRETE